MFREELEEDYEANYPDGWRPDPYSERCIPVGLCHRMCTYEEMQERETQGRLSKYEILADSRPPKVDFSLAIKEFRRSTVGREFTHAMDLRPWSVLKHALHHLLLTICLKDDDWMFVCDFVFDRLRAVRQDAVIQRLQGMRYIEILEGSVRFLVYSMYRLTCTLKDYTKSKPLERIISLEGAVSGLNNYELNVVREMKLTMKSLRECLSSLIVQYQENLPYSAFRPLFEAINLIVNLPFLPDHCENQTTFQSQSKLRNSDPMFKIVFKMYREHLAGNHWTALKYLPMLFDYPLLILAYAPAIAQLQVHLVYLLKKMYSAPGANTSTVRHLCAIICPQILEVDEDERILFGKLIAIQMGIYDREKNLCDYSKSKRKSNSPSKNGKAWMEEELNEESGRDNQTRAYALQMIFGKDWSFYQEALKIHGLEYILNPSQPSLETLARYEE